LKLKTVWQQAGVRDHRDALPDFQQRQSCTRIQNYDGREIENIFTRHVCVSICPRVSCP